ncbi:recombination-associated protein RdgC [Xenorhabdus sp. 42]|uniref:recombination-associated protein RdgC n=1 Tax=Xenorhabdus szentirmaii TaxID=290112 RepID=UPI0019CDC7D4|nr:MULTISPECIES: recombination-associated protein RdgC [unclassified Xenorhabdus]MBD2782209.1 recombination-associated protein RdgC [Xenorhabdus sp. 38]MBD2819718.1 recombination-associated protein RdgC [Xenorhabdus sp. 42]
MFNVFKNTLIYQLSRTVPNLTEADLLTLMPQRAFTPCHPHEASRLGWLMHDARPAMFVHGHHMLVVAIREKKDIPAAIIKEHLNAKRAKLESVQARKLRRSEIAQIKDDVIQELLPRAFPKRSTIQMWIDIDNGLISIDTTSPRTAEHVLALLRHTLGSLPVVPVATEIPFEQAMTDWLKDASTLPAKLRLSEKIKKADLIYDDGEVRFNKEDRLNNDEAVSMLLEQGRQVCTLGIHVDTQYGLDLELTHSCKLKKLQFGEAFSTQNQAEEDELSREYADFILMVNELRTAYTLIFDALGNLQAPRE